MFKNMVKESSDYRDFLHEEPQESFCLFVCLFVLFCFVLFCFVLFCFVLFFGSRQGVIFATDALLIGLLRIFPPLKLNTYFLEFDQPCMKVT